MINFKIIADEKDSTSFTGILTLLLSQVYAQDQSVTRKLTDDNEGTCDQNLL